MKSRRVKRYTHCSDRITMDHLKVKNNIQRPFMEVLTLRKEIGALYKCLGGNQKDANFARSGRLPGASYCVCQRYVKE